jgi:hypothetical protein
MIQCSVPAGRQFTLKLWVRLDELEEVDLQLLYRSFLLIDFLQVSELRPRLQTKESTNSTYFALARHISKYFARLTSTEDMDSLGYGNSSP